MVNLMNVWLLFEDIRELLVEVWENGKRDDFINLWNFWEPFSKRKYLPFGCDLLLHHFPPMSVVYGVFEYFNSWKIFELK